ncbi:hypothetical protein LC724_16490 [Blautia sp. RD014234]|nr:hypothetical protein [Blautia parvula]
MHPEPENRWDTHQSEHRERRHRQSGHGHPGDVFKSSILSNADHIIAVHNHPSGKILPSRSDLYITQRLRLGGELMGIPLSRSYHHRGGSGQMFSFREHGLLQADPKEMEQFFRSMKKEACRER